MEWGWQGQRPAAHRLLSSLPFLAVLALAWPVPGGAQTGASAGAASAGSDSARAAPDSTQAQGAVPAPPPFGTPDSVFQQKVASPIVYSSSYDLDKPSGMWTQTLSYGFQRGPLAVDLSGNSTTVDDILKAGIGGRAGALGGVLNYRAARRWILTMDGRFDASSAGNPLTGTRQHSNRIALRSQYSVDPWKTVSLRTLLSTEFQRDNNLSYQQTQDTTAYSQRDSTTVNGRQDGITAQLDWKPLSALTASIQGAGSRLTPVTRTVFTLFRRGSAGGGETDSVAPPTEAPITNSSLLGNFGFTGIRKLTAGLQLKRIENAQEAFDPSLRGQERTSVSQRSGALHLESTPRPPLSLSVDGTLSRLLTEKRLGKPALSLIHSQNAAGQVSYTRPATLASVRLEVTRSKSYEETRLADGHRVPQNSVSISRFLTANLARRVTPRLTLDGAGTATLISYQFSAEGTEPFANDRDQLRTFLNVGGRYSVSSRCSTTVHFSTSRTHTVAIGAQSSGGNVVLTDYQLNATMLLQASRTLSIQQNYMLTAAYQMYDYEESRDLLSRIKRINTIIADTLMPFVYATVVHNFQFNDAGPFVRPDPGAKRLYNVTVEQYQQNLGVTVGLRAPSGVNAFATQNLANTRNRSVVSGAETVTNRWTLTYGGDVARTLLGNTQLQVSAKHVGAYTERPPGCTGSCNFDPLEEAYWVVNAAVQKAF